MERRVFLKTCAALAGARSLAAKSLYADTLDRLTAGCVSAADQLAIDDAGIAAAFDLYEDLHRRHVVIAVGKEVC